MLSLCQLQDRLGCHKLNLTEIETQVANKKRLIVFQVQCIVISWKASIPVLGRVFFK